MLLLRYYDYNLSNFNSLVDIISILFIIKFLIRIVRIYFDTKI